MVEGSRDSISGLFSRISQTSVTLVFGYGADVAKPLGYDKIRLYLSKALRVDQVDAFSLRAASAHEFVYVRA